jgi:uncharacterized membrane protein
MGMIMKKNANEQNQGKYFQHMTEVEDEHLRKLHDIAVGALKEEAGLVKVLYKHSKDSKMTFGQKIADKVAAFGGSWPFIISFIIILLGWILVNLYTRFAFDSYPFILLNLVLSCTAALQAPIIMMSQNRKEMRDKKRAEHEYLINLKAELEIRELNQKLDLLMIDQIKNLLEVQKEQMKTLDLLVEKVEDISLDRSEELNTSSAKS